jgi:hypothetical protein
VDLTNFAADAVGNPGWARDQFAESTRQYYQHLETKSPYEQGKAIGNVFGQLEFLAATAGVGGDQGVGQVDAVGSVPNLYSHTGHSLDQKITRSIRSVDELETLRNPIDASSVRLDAKGRPSQKLIGPKATLVVNPKNKKIVTLYPTSGRQVRQLH